MLLANRLYVLIGLLVASTQAQDCDEINGTDSECLHSVYQTIAVKVNSRSMVTIALSNSTDSQQGRCTLQFPDETRVKLEDLGGFDDIQSFPSTIFNDCRVVIGPFTNDRLIGSWTLCAVNGTHRRCQTTDIRYARPSNPDANWQRTVHPRVDHPVHLGAILSPGVRGTGQLINCHVVTPFGEDLVVNPDSDYPFLMSNVRPNVPDYCSVTIGPMTMDMLGEWEVYGTFSFFANEINEVRQPMKFFLYDEEDPYSQSYNVTNLALVKRVVRLGNTVEMEVTGADTTNDCLVTLPDGQRYNRDTIAVLDGVSFDDDTDAKCRLRIGPIAAHMTGFWELSGKFHNRNMFIENRLPFEIIEEDPANPLEEDRHVEYLPELIVTTNLGTLHDLVIRKDLWTLESCHLRTPSGLQYVLMEGFHHPNVEVVDDPSVYCRVSIKVAGEDEVGTWTLISREGPSYERRQPIIISVEEEVRVHPNEVTIAAGSNLYLRLEQPIEEYASCKVIMPESEDQQLNIRFSDTEEEPLDTSDLSNYIEFLKEEQNRCGFMFRNIQQNQTGEWKITYGNKIKFVGHSKINVVRRAKRDLYDEIDVDGDEIIKKLTWTLGTAVNVTLGPAEAVDCIVYDPSGFVWSKGPGRCKVEVKKVGLEHGGQWKMNIVLPGNILATPYSFQVTAEEPTIKPLIMTSIKYTESTLQLDCALPEMAGQLQSCRFIDPANQWVKPIAGVGGSFHTEDGHQFELITDKEERQCSLKVKWPTPEHRGAWKCLIKTDLDAFYAIMRTDSTKDLKLELKNTEELIQAKVGGSVTMMCAIDAPLEYCYFLSPSGTVISAEPPSEIGTFRAPQTMYAGMGLWAGECGLTLINVTHDDAGAWTCNVALSEPLTPRTSEKTQRFGLQVTDLMTATRTHGTNGQMVLTVHVPSERPIQYCRFVRADGLAFSDKAIHEGYLVTADLERGHCVVTAPHPTPEDNQAWSAFVRFAGNKPEEIGRKIRSVEQPATVTTVFTGLALVILPACAVLTLVLFAVGVTLPGRRRWHEGKKTPLPDALPDAFSNTAVLHPASKV